MTEGVGCVFLCLDSVIFGSISFFTEILLLIIQRGDTNTQFKVRQTQRLSIFLESETIY